MRSYSVTAVGDIDKVEKVTDDMADLQATIEISVELNRFFNVDLFQRGCYQIQVVLKTPLKSLVRVEVSDNKINAQKEGSPETAATYKPSCTAKTQKFQILYRNEEVDIGEIFIFRVHTLVESTKLQKNLENLDLRLEIQLWCHDENELSESADEKMDLASSRTLLLHLSPTKGLHHSLPVLFDYFHLAAIEIVIHGVLVSIHQAYLTTPKSLKTGKSLDQSSLEAVYFGQKMVATSVSPPSNVSSSSVRMQQAHLMHKTICNILLSAHESLQDYLQQYAAMIPGSNFQLECKDCLTKLGETVMKVQGVLEEDDLIQTALTDITQICAENVILWAQFLEIVLKQQQVHLHLAMEHHTQRVRRFAEGFFTMEHNKSSCLSCYDPSFHGHASLANIVKNSAYFCNLPSLSVECIELDGDENTLPVIFEDIFCDSRAHLPQLYQKAAPIVSNGSMFSSRERSSSNSSSSVVSDQGTSPHLRKRSSKKKKFIKNMKPDGLRRPTSYRCRNTEAINAKLENTSAPTRVTLIGYRKIPVSDTTDTTVAGPLERTYSLPPSSRFPNSCLKVGSEQYVPAKFESVTSTRLSSAICTPEVSGILLSDKISNASTYNSATLSQSPCIYLKHTPFASDSSLAVTSKPLVVSVKDSIVKSYSVNIIHHTSSDQFSSKALPFTPVLKKSASDRPDLTKEDLNHLADDISRSLGEKEPPAAAEMLTTLLSSKDDVSDEDTNVANGFDEVLSTYRPDLSESQLSSDKTAVPALDPSSQTSFSHDHGSSLPLLDKVSDISRTTDSRLSDSALGSEISSREEISSSGSPSTIAESVQLNSDTDLSVSTTAAAAAALPSNRQPLIDESQKMTVLELLKEEYSKSLKGGVDAQEVNSPDTEITNPSEPNSFAGHRAASDSDILKNCEEKSMNLQKESQELLHSTAASIDGSEKRRALLTSSSSYPELSQSLKPGPPRLTSIFGLRTTNFVQLRENLKLEMDFPGYLCSECPVLASNFPYFHVPSDVDESSGIHLIVCVHGLDGNSADLRLVRTFIEMALPGFKLEFLMSERNQQDTFADFDKMTDRLVEEILTFLDTFGLQVTRVSFVGHSLGNIIIRSTLSRPEMSHLLPKLYTLLSLSGPHLGTLYNTSGLVNMGMWFMQKWKKSGSLLQLSLKDHSDPRQSFLYKLSQKPVLQHFKHVLLVGSHQDRYVPYHSSRIEICRSAQKDGTVTGAVYREMVQNILEPIIQSPLCTLIRYDVFHALPSTANTMIGRAAHIAVLDSEIFIEKFLAVTGLKYFK